jgi:hypothetical protein
MRNQPTHSDPPKRKRRRFQSSLRTLMVVTAVLSLAVAWLASQAKMIGERERLLAEIERSGGGYVETTGEPIGVYDPPLIDHGRVDENRRPSTTEYPRPSIVRKWLGDKIILMISCSGREPAELSQIKLAFPEAEVLDEKVAH